MTTIHFTDLPGYVQGAMVGLEAGLVDRSLASIRAYVSLISLGNPRAWEAWSISLMSMPILWPRPGYRAIQSRDNERETRLVLTGMARG